MNYENYSQLSPTPYPRTVGNHPIGGYHHLGGTRMSDDPAHGVVDADCRVHGYGNLHIAGSSVFSTAGWANPTFTIVALALRLGGPPRHSAADPLAGRANMRGHPPPKRTIHEQ
jgi:choline dehydrogenase-like flavoprotein